MSVKTKIKTISWSLLGLCCVVLLVAAMKAKDARPLTEVEIRINGAAKNMFVKHVDVQHVLNEAGAKAGAIANNINLKATEVALEKNAWIKDAELFFDNRQVLHVNITEREPIARVFTQGGSSFYIDSTGLRLPPPGTATARLVVFTAFPSDRQILSKPDSLVLNDVKRLALYLAADSFLNAQTAQVHITPQRTYEITPVVGNQVIRIGDAGNLPEKFAKLLAFYKQVYTKAGFERYSVIDVQYAGQVVAVKRGEGYTITTDTARAIRQLKQADAKLRKALNDTLYAAPVPKPVADTMVVKAQQGTTAAQQGNSTGNKGAKGDEKQPKAVMKKKG